ncbi:Serine/threonine-protein kinase CTR1 [Hordeum vulgare]|nr:Serine/threonine-protein kinase CTR1 [Hordeum vulgare]
MDALSSILCKATEVCILSSFRGISPLQRLSVYADDVAMFIRPSHPDLICVRELLDIFGEASRLCINYTKSATILIRGTEEDGLRVTDVLHCRLSNFPCKYLGIPLAIRKLSRAHWQPLLDEVRKLIPAWQRGIIQRPGRLILVKSVISARPVHQLLMLNAPTWVFEEIDKWLKVFFWARKEKANGGLCLVAWEKVCLPTCLGGLGVKDLRVRPIALLVR